MQALKTCSVYKYALMHRKPQVNIALNSMDSTPATRSCKQCLLVLALATGFYTETKPYANGSPRYKWTCKSCSKKNAVANDHKRAAVTRPTVDTKTCSMCNVDKPATAFSTASHHWTGLQDRCSDCSKANSKRASAENRRHQQQAGATMHCRTCAQTKAAASFVPGKTQCRLCSNSVRQFRRHNDTRFKLEVSVDARLHCCWQCLRTSSDVEGREQEKCRNRLNDAIRRQKGAKSEMTTSLIGCSWEKLMDHIESQFHLWPGMSWDNMNEWHIDHRQPCKSFDLREVAEQRKCFHFSNLQPLWACDNLAKGARLDWTPDDAPSSKKMRLE